MNMNDFSAPYFASPGAVLVPDTLPVHNCSVGRPNIEKKDPVEVTHLFADGDEPNVFLVNLRGHGGSFPVTAFHSATDEELAKAGRLIVLKTEGFGLGLS